MKNSCLIVGGTGFFGRAIFRQIDDWYKTFGRIGILSRGKTELSNFKSFKNTPLNYYNGDVSLHDSFSIDSRYTHVVHMASNSSYGHLYDDKTRFNEIFIGTLNVLRLAASVGAKRFLYISSGAVYGDYLNKKQPVIESITNSNGPHCIPSVYGQAKFQAENLCLLYGRQLRLQVSIARCFSFLGPDLPIDKHYAAGSFINDAINLSKTSIDIKGSGAEVRSYMDQRDLVKWLQTILVYSDPESIYNVGSDKPIKLHDLAILIKNLIAPSKILKIFNQQPGYHTNHYYVPSNAKANAELGLQPMFSLKESVTNILRTFSSNEPRFSYNNF